MRLVANTMTRARLKSAVYFAIVRISQRRVAAATGWTKLFRVIAQ
jgi:hypothetical protein